MHTLQLPKMAPPCVACLPNSPLTPKLSCAPFCTPSTLCKTLRPSTPSPTHSLLLQLTVELELRLLLLLLLVVLVLQVRVGGVALLC